MSKTANAISRGLRFLTRQQLPSGQFPIQATLHYKPGSPVVDDASPFATSHVVYSLGFCEETNTQMMIKPALAYLKREMTKAGLWRYWNRNAVWEGRRISNFIPADLDDTASHSWLLRHHAVAFPNNRSLLLHNRDQTGRFYTWFVPRLRATTNLSYWKAIISELTVGRLALFWQTTEAAYNDVDAVVNANVLFYLGQCSATQPVIQWLARLVEQGHEQDSDKWYRDLFTFHYAVSRCHQAGISGFERLGSVVIDRLKNKQRSDGLIGERSMHTALALNTLLNYGADMRLAWVHSALRGLVSHQDSDGGWPSVPYYYGGPQQNVSWGSRELTTALCIEALVRYQKAEQDLGQ